MPAAPGQARVSDRATVEHATARDTNPGRARRFTAKGATRAAHVPTRPSRLQAGLKRTFDLVVACLMLLVLLPVMAVVALAILIESPGPVFFSADRVGRGGRRIRMLKFRKMHPDAGGLRLTVDDDPRLTRVGAVLRRTRLDELPQLLNVVHGDMSLIGPRPEDPGFVVRRQADYECILRVRPGMTGLSQIAFLEEGKLLTSGDPLTTYVHRVLPAKCALDRLYVGSASLSTDLRILGWTFVATVLRFPVAVHRTTGGMSLRKPRVADAAPDIGVDRPVAAAVVAGAGADDVV